MSRCRPGHGRELVDKGPPLELGENPGKEPRGYTILEHLELLDGFAQVLGLPGEPRVDKSVPWNEVPRN